MFLILQQFWLFELALLQDLDLPLLLLFLLLPFLLQFLLDSLLPNYVLLVQLLRPNADHFLLALPLPPRGLVLLLLVLLF